MRDHAYIRNRVVAVAASQVGVTEATGRNDGIPAERYNGGGLPWCGAFVVWVWREAEHPIHLSEKQRWLFRSVAQMMAEFERRGVLMGPRIRPLPGDIYFRTRRGGMHVGIVESVSLASFGTIEGNLRDAVGRDVLGMTDRRLAGFARPCGGWAHE